MNAAMRKKALAAFKRDLCAWRATNFYGFIKPRPGGEFTLTVYAVNWTKTHGYRVAEVNRAWSDRPFYVCKDVWRNMWGSISVEWDETSHRRGLECQWYNGRWGKKVRWDKHGGYWYAPWVKIVNMDALKETAYRYCGYEFYDGGLSLVEYTTLWKRHKGVELLAKAGLTSLISEKMAAKMERDRGFALFVRANAKEIAAGHLRSGRCHRANTVVCAYKNGWTVEEAWDRENARYSLNRAPKGIDRSALYAYLKKNDIDIEDYYGYCGEVAKAGEDILAFGVTYPKDFHSARTRMQRKIEKAEKRRNAERDAALKSLAERINALLERMTKRLAWRVGDFSVTVPTTQKEFRDEGNAMHNCMAGYYSPCAEGKTVCFFVKRGGRRVADVEMSPSSGKVVQCRAKFNKPADSETVKFSKAVAKEVAKMLRRGGKKGVKAA